MRILLIAFFFFFSCDAEGCELLPIFSRAPKIIRNRKRFLKKTYLQAVCQQVCNDIGMIAFKTNQSK